MYANGVKIIQNVVNLEITKAHQNIIVISEYDLFNQVYKGFIYGA
jgi:hypothetical protein